MKKIDRLLITFVEQHLSSIAFLFLTLLSIVIRLKFIHFVDFNDGITDYNTALVPWINLYKEFGFVLTYGDAVVFSGIVNNIDK